MENGLLLREAKQNAMFREWGYDSFDEAIEALHASGKVDYGPRQARNLIAVVDLFDQLGSDEKKSLGISKLSEIATCKKLPEAQKELLENAENMTVEEVKKAAKAIRDKAAGRDVDPLDPYTLKLSATQKTFFKECLQLARKEYSISEDVPDEAVLIDALLADWRSGCSAEL